MAVGDDTDAALAGAFAGRPGIVVIAGTGSGAAGRDAAGRTVRVGGHGFLLGDEGGGYWIGREAVRAALRAADGTGPPTALIDVVRAAFDTLTGAETEVHQRPTDATCSPAWSPTGRRRRRNRRGRRNIRTARGRPTGRPDAGRRRGGSTGAARRDGATPAGDAVAARILAEAAAHLAELAAAVRARLGDLPVAGVGGIFACAPVAAAFTAATGARRAGGAAGARRVAATRPGERPSPGPCRTAGPRCGSA